MKVIVDAMGGDYAPEVVVKGAVEAVSELDVELILVGDETKIKIFLEKFSYPKKKISIYHASEIIEMYESAALSVRKKRESSVVVGLELLKKGYADAFFSAGNTGAVVCAATLVLGLLKGVERPGIAIHIPTLKGISLVIDVGANIDPKPLHLLQYAIMANSYFEAVLNRKNPKIGLLNIGEEETKGTEFMRQAHQLISESFLKNNFLGNIDGKDLFSGKCDIIICDGFIGNVALKVSESMLEFIYNLLKRSLKNNPVGILGLTLLSLGMKRIYKKIDYTEYGGAPLLGIDGIVIVGHGRSNAKAIKNAIRVAKEEVEIKLNEKISKAIAGTY
ncbi:MAG: phosphate acyltransferase PlsX [Candidatus Omnitrophica bacterium]|nr:phosphate acyltransferase PlsX [Candidatus Omnitrophota bacterium]